MWHASSDCPRIFDIVRRELNYVQFSRIWFSIQVRDNWSICSKGSSGNGEISWCFGLQELSVSCLSWKSSGTWVYCLKSCGYKNRFSPEAIEKFSLVVVEIWKVFWVNFKESSASWLESLGSTENSFWVSSINSDVCWGFRSGHKHLISLWESCGGSSTNKPYWLMSTGYSGGSLTTFVGEYSPSDA